MKENKVLYLDDLYVGQEFRSEQHQIDAQQIMDFARQFDPQPFHTDEVAAQSTFFQGLAASGWHTAAITMKLQVRSMNLGRGTIGVECNVKWTRPVRPGDTLYAVSKVVQIVPSCSKPDRAIVTIECSTLNQHDDVCQFLVSKVLVLRRPQ